MLPLVLADGHLVGPVCQHVGGHQDRVEQQAGGDELALGHGLVAELVHPLQAPQLGGAGQQPCELGVGRHVTLAEEDAAVGVEAGGDQDRGRVIDALAQFGRVVGDRDRVQVDDAEEPLAALLA